MARASYDHLNCSIARTMEVIGEDGSHDRSTRCAGDLGNVHFDDSRIA